MSPQQTRQQIIEKALSFFAHHDYERSSLDQISRDLGVTKGAIYHYFDGKDQLFEASVQLLLDVMRSMIGGVFESDLPFEKLIRQLLQIDDMMADVQELTGIPAILANYEQFLYMIITGVKKFPSLKKSMGDIYQGFIKDLSFELNRAIQRKEVRADIDVEAIAFEISAFYEGALLIDAVTDRTSFLDLTPRVLDQIWKRISLEKKPETKEEV